MVSLQRDSHVCCFRKNFIHSYVKFFMLHLQHVGTTDLIFGIFLVIVDEQGIVELYGDIIRFEEAKQPF